MTDDRTTLGEVGADIKGATIRVTQQRETIARLEELGEDTQAARLLLRTLEKELALLIARSDALKDSA
jgi:hypothetical protein